MQITTDTADSLGQKLAALDLTNAEGALLHSLLAAGADDAEVSGFVLDKSSTKFASRVVGALPPAFRVETSGYIVTQDLQD